MFPFVNLQAMPNKIQYDIEWTEPDGKTIGPIRCLSRDDTLLLIILLRRNGCELFSITDVKNNKEVEQHEWGEFTSDAWITKGELEKLIAEGKFQRLGHGY
jgi:hypothetical protein